MIYENNIQFAKKLDKEDKLSKFRSYFEQPEIRSKNVLYFCGNSLGLKPKTVDSYLKKELTEWSTKAVDAHFEAEIPWYYYHHHLKKQTANIVGANQSEVVCMNTLTTNLHLLLISFYRPKGRRKKILIEKNPFSSDLYMLKSQIKLHGLSPEDVIVEVEPRKHEHIIRIEDIENKILEFKKEIALVFFGGVNYFTGQFFNIKRIVKAAHQNCIFAGFDLAHAVGNVSLKLNSWDVDFAAWCSYKYLNSGPGGISGVYVNKKHHNSKLNRLEGWWGVKENERFNMPRNFLSSNTVDSWQLSNPSILSMASHKASLDIFLEAGMKNLVNKSRLLTGYLIFLLKDIFENKIEYSIITPEKKDERGCQVSLMMGKEIKFLYDYLIRNGVIVDFRKPNVIRISPVPLYNSFLDVYSLYQHIKDFVNNIKK
tara:strand:- start:1049 stop:2326 length:1278 start_codon:yes stop_codon:yes gene_type:complete